MIPVLVGLARTYAPFVMLPIAAVVGAIGYKIEWSIRDKKNPTGGPQNKSVQSIREERLLEQMSTVSGDATIVDSLKEKKIIPKTIFDKNLSPSLQNS